MEVDLHIHTRYSQDSLTRPERIVKHAIAAGLGAVAVTDHNSWEGARAVAKVAGESILVVQGAELKTDKGDLLALFVDQEIRTRNWDEAVDEIRSLGGISIIPHPADSKKLTREDMLLADGVEAFNSTCSPASNSEAMSIMRDLRKPGIASSDAHMAIEIGNGSTRVEGCSSLDELRRSLLKNPILSRTNPSNRFTHFLNASLCFGLKGIWRL